MKAISRKEKITKTVKKLKKLREMLEERLRKTDQAMIGAQRISKEIEKIKNSK